jgi:hypothetical protein
VLLCLGIYIDQINPRKKIMIKELKLEKMDRSEMRKIDGGGEPLPAKCDGCCNCGTTNSDSLNTFVSG